MDDYISVATAARLLGIERQSAYRYIRLGKLKAHRVAGRLVVDPDDLEGVRVPPPGGLSNHKRSPREWTLRMTHKRLSEWNAAVAQDRFTGPDGKVDADAIADFEQQHGWTYDELLDAVDRLEAR